MLRIRGAGPRVWAKRIGSRASVPIRRRRYEQTHTVDLRRIEIGPGKNPTQGFFHIDVWPWASHLEAIAPMWKLPLPDNWAVEVRAVHALEHVEPPRLVPTLQEWRRVLVPGGLVHISVPNGPAIMVAFQNAAVADKWPLMGSLLGMYCNPQSRDPGALDMRSDHQIIFDRDVLAWALQQAGYKGIDDVTDQVTDRHTEGWAPLVKHYSLIMQARA